VIAPRSNRQVNRGENGRQRDLVLLGLLAVVVLWMWAGERRSPANSAMEEGFMLVLPLRELHGAIQARDFHYFYGPVSLWFPAALYKILGASLEVERLIGAFYVYLVAAGLYLIGRVRSRPVGLSMGLTAVLFAGGTFNGLPLLGGLGLLLLAVGLCSFGRRAWWMVGIAAGLSVDLRPDYALWASVVLAVMLLLRLVHWRAAVIYALVVAVPYGLLCLQARFGNVYGDLVTASLRLRAERKLPLPAFDSAGGRLELLVVLAVLVAIVSLTVRGSRQLDLGPRLAIVLLLTGICLLPEYWQRSDVFHLAPAAMILTAAAVFALSQVRIGNLAIVVVPVLVVATLGLTASQLQVPSNTFRDLSHLPSGGHSYPVSNEGRTWYYGAAGQAAVAQQVVEAVDQSRARSLFVGTADLRQTPYTDNSFYYLLPQLREPSHFFDFHPGIALYQSNQLAADVTKADVLILWSITSHERNLSSRYGPDTANLVVSTRFGRVLQIGGYTVYYSRRLAPP
jgi:hypothetical protein